ncbi:MAG TPA: hypothetical protein VI911_08770 [Patescibacteria group bacterium]|nr:MAG: hypothetical protein UR43_C0005G0078 [candidate division TM6 bacterium GW2011_GWF2_33_332]HLD91089.1 hypothetical protein [Patescibacteria group bacterium]
MNDKIDLLNEKVNLIYDIVKDSADDLKQMKGVQITQGFDIAQNKTSLVEHMKRTELLENRVDIIEKPIEIRKYIYEKISKFFKFIAIPIGIAVAIFELINYLK